MSNKADETIQPASGWQPNTSTTLIVAPIPNTKRKPNDYLSNTENEQQGIHETTQPASEQQPKTRTTVREGLHLFLG